MAKNKDDYPRIREIYKDKTVFITGASGFIGKVLIEKLLRSCPDLKRIYVLLRPKRGLNSEERLAKIFAQPVSRFKTNPSEHHFVSSSFSVN